MLARDGDFPPTPLFSFVSVAGRDTAWLMLAQSCGMLGTHQDRRHFPGQLFK